MKLTKRSEIVVCSRLCLYKQPPPPRRAPTLIFLSGGGFSGMFIRMPPICDRRRLGTQRLFLVHSGGHECQRVPAFPPGGPGAGRVGRARVPFRGLRHSSRSKAERLPHGVFVVCFFLKFV